MSPWLRAARFYAVGAAGIGVQLATVWLLAGVAHVHDLAATSAAVGVAVVHNFAWHRRWTWGDREAAAGPVAMFVRFAAANGAVSLAGNLVAMAALVPLAHMTPVAANAVAIAVTGVLNFHVGDVVVFRRRCASKPLPRKSATIARCRRRRSPFRGDGRSTTGCITG